MTYYIGGMPGAQVTLTTGDLEIGAVELKNATDDTRGKVVTASSAAVGDNAVVVADPNLDAKGVELDLSAAPTQVSLTTSTARSAQLAVGRYVVKSDAPTFVRQGNGSSDATVTTDFKLEAGVCYVLNVTNTTTLGYLSGILSTGTGTLDIQATL